MTDWIEWKWTPEKPRPETGKRVYIRENDGWESEICNPEREWEWRTDEYGHGITHYRIEEDQ